MEAARPRCGASTGTSQKKADQTVQEVVEGPVEEGAVAARPAEAEPPAVAPTAVQSAPAGEAVEAVNPGGLDVSHPTKE